MRYPLRLLFICPSPWRVLKPKSLFYFKLSTLAPSSASLGLALLAHSLSLSLSLPFFLSSSLRLSFFFTERRETGTHKRTHAGNARGTVRNTTSNNTQMYTKRRRRRRRRRRTTERHYLFLSRYVLGRGAATPLSLSTYDRVNLFAMQIPSNRCCC